MEHELNHNLSWWDCVLKGFGWEVAVVAGVLLLSVALGVYESSLVQQHATLADVMRAHLLAAWSYTLGLVGLAAIVGWMFVRGRTRCL